jgi:hypothetical protein
MLQSFIRYISLSEARQLGFPKSRAVVLLFKAILAENTRDYRTKKAWKQVIIHDS